MESFLARHRAFWERQAVDRPLQREVGRYAVSRSGVEPMKLPLADGSLAPEGLRLTPELLDPATVHAGYREGAQEAAFGRTLTAEREEYGAELAVSGDVFAPVAPYSLVPWVEAILGCPIQVSLKAHSMWSLPPYQHLGQIDQITADPAWLDKLREFTAFLVEHSGGRFLVTQTLMRGVSDMLEALVGGEGLGLAIYDDPVKFHEIAAQCAELFIQIARAQLELIPRFQGGLSNPFGIWAPGSSIRTQDDASALLSAAQYAEFILPHQERIAAAFDYSVIHLHSACLHVAEAICDSSISAVQVSLDPVPFGPTVPELLPRLARILEKKPLILEGPCTPAELDLLRNVLDPRGLFIGVSLESEEDRARI